MSFEGWKRDGVFSDYLLLFSSYADTSKWDALAVLSFDAYGDMERWRAIERKRPGGLAPEGLALAAPVGNFLADLTWEKTGEARDPSRAVYFVIPYSYQNKGEYKNYADTYVTPEPSAEAIM